MYQERTLREQYSRCIRFVPLYSRRQNRFKAVLAGPAAAASTQLREEKALLPFERLERTTARSSSLRPEMRLTAYLLFFLSTSENLIYREIKRGARALARTRISTFTTKYYMQQQEFKKRKQHLYLNTALFAQGESCNVMGLPWGRGVAFGHFLSRNIMNKVTSPV